MKRRPIPLSIAAEVLFLSDHTCCICRTRRKDVQLHHIDGDKRHHNRLNLAVVCLDCHSLVTGSRGLGRSYVPAEVRLFKRSWEEQVLATRKIHKPIKRYQKELISQIDLIVCEILACRKSNPRVEELLQLLWEIHLWRGSPAVDGKIIEGLHHLALMSGLGSSHLAPMVAEKLWEMCFHYVGPDKVKMDAQAMKKVIECIEALETLGSFNCEFGHGRNASKVIPRQLEHFLEIGIWYSRRRIVDAVITAYNKGLEACLEDGKLTFALGRKHIRDSARRMLSLLRREKAKWRPQQRRLEQILAD